jgi:anaerobic selenocysteine-containing dehydrogenase
VKTVIPSYCRICPALCGVLVEVSRGLVVGVKGDRDHPLSRGYTCPKGRLMPEEHNAPDRLRSSMRRTSQGAFEAIPSETAVKEIAGRLEGIIAQHGPRSVALYVGTRGYELLQLAGATAWLDGIGSPSFYSTYTIDQPGKDLARSIHGSWPAGFQDVSTSDVVMLVGNNPLVSGFAAYTSFPVTNPRVQLKARRRAGQKMIVIDPRRSETAVHADIHLQPLPGHDAEILGSMIRVIIAEDLFDREFVDRWTEGIDGLRRGVAPFDPQSVAVRSGLEAADIVAAARMFAAGPRGCAVGGTGLNMSPHPILGEYLLLCLNSLCGRYRRAGESVPNPGVLTAGRSVNAGVRRPRTISGGGAQPRFRGLSTMYGQMPSSALADEILQPGDGQIRALMVSGGNPLVALPDFDKTLRALQSLELLVCLDVRMAHTASMADYVIGCKLALEKADTTLASDLRFPEPFAQITPAVVLTTDDLVEEWEYFWMLATAMGTPWDLQRRIGMPIPIDSSGLLPADRKPTAMEIWQMLCSSGRISFDEVRAHPHGLAPNLDPVLINPAADDNHDRLELADEAMIAELEAVAAAPIEPGLGFRLISRRMWEFHNSWGQNIASLRESNPASPAFMNPADLAHLGIDDGDLVAISSAHGTIETVAQAADDIRRGVVSMTHCWGSADPAADVRVVGASTNRLVDNESDLSAIVGMARQSAIPVSVTSSESQPR